MAASPHLAMVLLSLACLHLVYKVDCSCPTIPEIERGVEECKNKIDLDLTFKSRTEGQLSYCRELSANMLCLGAVFGDCTAYEMRGVRPLLSDASRDAEKAVRDKYVNQGCYEYH